MRRLLGLVGVCLLLLTGTQTALTQQNNDFGQFVLETRTDLETLANEFLGEGNRPEGWTFNFDVNSPMVVNDLWFDNEQLADEIFGLSQRPTGWFGATTTDAALLARNTRHDLELSADVVYDSTGRPDDWIGADPIFRCDRTIQNTLRLLNAFYGVESNTPQSVVDYCRAVAEEIDTNLIQAVLEDTGGQAVVEGVDSLPSLILALRGDLERLANEVYGVNTRPNGWIGNVDPNSSTLLADSAADIEILADEIFGAGERPPEWAAFQTPSLSVTYRNLRFNLEVLADRFIGAGERPNGWQGDSLLARCTPSQQSLVLLVEVGYGFQIDPNLTESDSFCALVTFAANDFAENPPQEVIAEESEEDAENEFYTAESNIAFSYLDVAALDYMGMMPRGTVFRAWYRNFSPSTMMFVSGQDFALYIDRRFTTMTEEVFNTLPTLEGVIPLTFCDAGWCNGPSPTPTPTGDGALQQLLLQQTPVATRDPVSVGQETGKRQVSWNHIRITYLQDRPETNTVQVALEICQEPERITCEPVTSVFDNATGQNRPVLSTFNGLNVYEFRYGYNNTVIVEGATLVSPDIWISDPTIR